MELKNGCEEVRKSGSPKDDRRFVVLCQLAYVTYTGINQVGLSDFRTSPLIPLQQRSAGPGENYPV